MNPRTTIHPIPLNLKSTHPPHKNRIRTLKGKHSPWLPSPNLNLNTPKPQTPDNIYPCNNRRIPPLHDQVLDTQKLKLTLNGIQLRTPPLLRHHDGKTSKIDTQRHRRTDPTQINRTQPEITHQCRRIPVQRSQHLRVDNKFVKTHT